MILNLLPFIPLMSFLVLIIAGKKLTWQQNSALSVGAMAIAFAMTCWLLFTLNQQESGVITSHFWRWFSLTQAGSEAQASVNVAFYLDGLSAVMIAVVTGVGLLIHLFAAVYMKTDANFHRFMAYMNLFIVAMLILVLADNLVLLYLGWEGVGLCSFLLIGFWQHEAANAVAARKAFIVTRIGDTSMAIGLLLLFNTLGSLHIPTINDLAQTQWVIGNEKAYWIALLLLGGAVGKSAQLPLQTWLPDAMAGPTPVSALIHAATMVTAGVYLIARMQGVFLQAPEVMSYVAWIGGLTLLLAGIAALVQTDIKRVLAYSTMSQIGYMMLALGAGAWSSAVFHLMTHAFFKALLFLTAGAIIYALHHQQNIFKMGGLLKKLPVESTLFIIGLICLMALPGTSGFFSKEAIINQLWSSPTAGQSLWWLAIFGALLTSIYSCRLFFLVFMGKAREPIKVSENNSKILMMSLIVLAALSLLGGLLSPDLTKVFISAEVLIGQEPSWLHFVAIATPFIGIAFSWLYFKDYRLTDNSKIKSAYERSANNPLKQWCLNGLGFDGLYRWLLIKPFVFIAKLNKRDLIDQLLMLNALYIRLWRDVLSVSQNGAIRWYAAGFATGLVLLIAGWLL